MAGDVSYSAISTKIRAMESHLLSDDNFRELASMASVTDAVLYLKNFSFYQNLFSDLEDNAIARANLERRLGQAIFYDFQKLYYFANQKQRQMILLLFRRYVPTYIKCCIDNIQLKQTDPSIGTGDLRHLYDHPFFVKNAKLDIKRLQNCSTIDDLIRALEKTGYDTPLKMVRNSQDSSLLQYEFAIDMYYFSNLWKKREDYFSGKHLEVLEHSIGSYLDLLNIQWIYRCKKYFMLSSAEITGLVIPIHYNLRKRELRQMIDAPSLDEFFTILRETHYGRKYRDSLQVQFEPGDIEKMQKQIRDKIYFSDTRQYPQSVAVINTYIHKKETEISKIITTLEGIRYSLTPSEILQLL